jgi:hypothetical protein
MLEYSLMVPKLYNELASWWLRLSTPADELFLP